MSKTLYLPIIPDLQAKVKKSPFPFEPGPCAILGNSSDVVDNYREDSIQHSDIYRYRYIATSSSCTILKVLVRVKSMHIFLYFKVFMTYYFIMHVYMY